MNNRSFLNKLRSLEDCSILSGNKILIEKFSEKMEEIQNLVSKIDESKFVESLTSELFSISATNLKNSFNYEFLHYGCLVIAYKYIENRDILNDHPSRGAMKELLQYSKVINKAEVEVAKLMRFDISHPTNALFFKLYSDISRIDFESEHVDYLVSELFRKIEKVQNRCLPSITAISLLYYSYGRILQEDPSHLDLRAFSNISGYQENEILYCLQYLSQLIDITPDHTDNVRITESKEYIENIIFRKDRVDSNGIINKDDITINMEIGTGGFSTVYQARYMDFDYAIKVFKCDKSPTKDTYPEITYLKYLSNASILSLVGIVEETSECFTVMTELLETDVFYLLKEGIDYDFKVRIVRQLLEAVRYMHSVGLVHGDLKPENILVRSRDIKIADFGGSKLRLYTERRSYYITHGPTMLYRSIENLMRVKDHSYPLDM